VWTNALALLFAARIRLGPAAVTCVAGNVGVDKVVANTLTVLDRRRRDCAGADGAPVPLVARRARTGGHGRDGMADLGWPPSTRTVDPRHAVELLRDEFDGRPAGHPGGPGAVDEYRGCCCAPTRDRRAHRTIVFVAGPPRTAVEFHVRPRSESTAIVLDALAASSTPVTM